MALSFVTEKVRHTVSSSVTLAKPFLKDLFYSGTDAISAGSREQHASRVHSAGFKPALIAEHKGTVQLGSQENKAPI